MVSTAENLHIQLLTEAMYKAGLSDELEIINKKMIEFISNGKLSDPVQKKENS